MKTYKEREAEFLIKLSQLTRETGVRLYGCGCCGSPGLDDLKELPQTTDNGYVWGYSDELVWITDNAMTNCDKKEWNDFKDQLGK